MLSTIFLVNQFQASSRGGRWKVVFSQEGYGDLQMVQV